MPAEIAAHRRRRWLLVGAAVLALGAASLLPFLRPDIDSPDRADAVVKLSGDPGERLPVAMALVERGAAPTLVFVGTRDRVLEDDLCAGAPAFEALCLRPQPDSTRDEARAVATLARSRGWRQLIVVTSDSHVTRSRLLFERCFDGAVEVVGARPTHSLAFKARLIAHEWLAVGHALTVARGC